MREQRSCSAQGGENTKETKLLGMLSVYKPTCLCSNHHVPFRYLKLIDEC